MQRHGPSSAEQDLPCRSPVFQVGRGSRRWRWYAVPKISENIISHTRTHTHAHTHTHIRFILFPELPHEGLRWSDAAGPFGATFCRCSRAWGAATLNIEMRQAREEFDTPNLTAERLRQQLILDPVFAGWAGTGCSVGDCKKSRTPAHLCDSWTVRTVQPCVGEMEAQRVVNSRPNVHGAYRNPDWGHRVTAPPCRTSYEF